MHNLQQTPTTDLMVLSTKSLSITDANIGLRFAILIRTLHSVNFGLCIGISNKKIIEKKHRHVKEMRYDRKELRVRSIKRCN